MKVSILDGLFIQRATSVSVTVCNSKEKSIRTISRGAVDGYLDCKLELVDEEDSAVDRPRPLSQ